MNRPDRELLRELSSLRELLELTAPASHENTSPAGPPPPVPPQREPPVPPLLDLAEIFDDESDDGEFGPIPEPALPPPRFTLEQPADPAAGDPGRERLIQALVDEHLPRLEAALREHLRGLDDSALRAWQGTDDN